MRARRPFEPHARVCSARTQCISSSVHRMPCHRRSATLAHCPGQRACTNPLGLRSTSHVALTMQVDLNIDDPAVLSAKGFRGDHHTQPSMDGCRARPPQRPRGAPVVVFNLTGVRQESSPIALLLHRFQVRLGPPGCRCRSESTVPAPPGGHRSVCSRVRCTCLSA
jgi:hypothetical protein